MPKLPPRLNQPPMPVWIGCSDCGTEASLNRWRESIEDPAAFIVEGYSDLMPKGFKILLSEEDIDGLVAFLLTQ